MGSHERAIERDVERFRDQCPALEVVAIRLTRKREVTVIVSTSAESKVVYCIWTARGTAREFSKVGAETYDRAIQLMMDLVHAQTYE